jgi:hypothetical protein
MRHATIAKNVHADKLDFSQRGILSVMRLITALVPWLIL